MIRNQRFRESLLLFLVLVLTTVPIFHGSERALSERRSIPSSGTILRARVWAYYYIWWGSGSWGSTNIKDSPTLGKYDSSNEDVIRQHVRWAKWARIKGFIISWDNVDWANSIVDTLTEVAEEENFKLAIIGEWLNDDLAAIDASLAVFFSRWSTRTPFKSWNGTPFIVFWGSWQYSGAQWEPILAKYRDRGFLLCCENSWNTGTNYIGKLNYFDGNAPYTPTRVQNSAYIEHFRQMAETCRQKGKAFLCSIGPGFDKESENLHFPREDGGLYKRSIALAKSFDPTGIAIVSWNEWLENTHIEPSVNYGYKYLEITQGFLGGQ